MVGADIALEMARLLPSCLTGDDLVVISVSLAPFRFRQEQQQPIVMKYYEETVKGGRYASDSIKKISAISRSSITDHCVMNTSRERTS
jgi:hypothetical protein